MNVWAGVGFVSSLALESVEVEQGARGLAEEDCGRFGIRAVGIGYQKKKAKSWSLLVLKASVEKVLVLFVVVRRQQREGWVGEELA